HRVAAGGRDRQPRVPDAARGGARCRRAARHGASPGGTARRVVPRGGLLCLREHDRSGTVRLQRGDRGRRGAASGSVGRRARRGRTLAHARAVLLRLPGFRRPQLPDRGLRARGQVAVGDASGAPARREIPRVSATHRSIACARAGHGRVRATRGGALSTRRGLGRAAAGGRPRAGPRGVATPFRRARRRRRRGARQARPGGLPRRTRRARPQPAPAARLAPGPVSPVRLAALRTGAVLARVEAGLVALTGPGAVSAAQGLLTNDVEKPGDGAFVYGALLTPKGMIVVDAWTSRLGSTVSFTVPAEGRERALAIFTRSVPPRLARLADRTAELAVYRLAGPNALAVAEAAGLPVPPGPGRVLPAPGGTSEVARATEGAPFTLQLAVPVAETEVVAARLAAAGAVSGDGATLELARILAGWPRLGAEVDDKTIPQEVRYDELGGVSYTKGCYTGQETVSRLHFRGHTNRYL